MRNAILIMLLAGMNGAAAAEWVLAGGNAITTAYYDPATVTKAGNLVKMWDMFDLTTARSLDNQLYRSMKRQVEYDCQKEQSRLLYYSGHSENMATGTEVFSGPEPQAWEPVSRGSGNEALWKIACGKQ
jgi:hypothetical protein